MKTRLWLLAAAALWATPALAENAGDTTQAGEDMGKSAMAKAGDAGASAKRVMDAVQLPAKASKLRNGGMSNDEVAGALDAAKDAGLTAGDAGMLLDAADAGADGDAWQGNFGSWVKSQLDEGKRGQDLAGAIAAEKDNRKASKEAAKADGSWGQAKKAEAGKAADAMGKAADKAADSTSKSAGRARAAGEKAVDKGADAAGASAGRARAAAGQAADATDKAADAAGASAGRARAGASKAADTTEEAAKKTGTSAGRARAAGEKKDN